MAFVRREAIVKDRDSNVVTGFYPLFSVQCLDGYAIQHFNALIAYLEITVKPEGGDMFIWLQRALRPEPQLLVDDDWEDYYLFKKINSTKDYVVHLDINPQANDPLVDYGWERVLYSLPEDRSVIGHFGDNVRVVEQINGNLSVPCKYSLYFTGH